MMKKVRQIKSKSTYFIISNTIPIVGALFLLQ